MSDIQVVRSTRVDVLDPSGAPSLTRVTCCPFCHAGGAPGRDIIRIILRSPAPGSAPARAAGLNPPEPMSAEASSRDPSPSRR